jgi:hypothetical protein
VNIDLRFPLGWLFIVFGVLLTLFGLFTDRATYERSPFINVNLWWGAVMLLFGGLMFIFAWKKAGRKRAKLPGGAIALLRMRLRFYERSSLPITAKSVTLLRY